jgi:hypothetical protein
MGAADKVAGGVVRVMRGVEVKAKVIGVAHGTEDKAGVIMDARGKGVEVGSMEGRLDRQPLQCG